MSERLSQRERAEILAFLNGNDKPSTRTRSKTPVRGAAPQPRAPVYVSEPEPVSVSTLTAGKENLDFRFPKWIKVCVILALFFVSVVVTTFNVVIPQSEKEIRDAVRSELVCMNAFGQLVDLCDARDAYMAAPVEQKKEAIQKVCTECPISGDAKSVCDQIPVEPFLEGIIVLGCNAPEKQAPVPFWAFWRTQNKKISPPMVTGPACTNFRASSRECTETFHRNVEKAKAAQTELAKKSIVHASPIWIPGIIQIPVITFFERIFSKNITDFFSMKNMWLQAMTTPMCAFIPSAIDIKNECIVMSFLWIFCTVTGHIAYSEDSIIALNWFYKCCIVGLIAGIAIFLVAFQIIKKYIKETLISVWGRDIMNVAIPIASFILWSSSGACIFLLYR